MDVTFWGVRGSVPAPGPATVRYGGNTSCVSVRTALGRLIVLDCGTGARNLGISLVDRSGSLPAPRAHAGAETRGQSGQADGDDKADALDAAILLSHAHWDHIQGFPFFRPLYNPKAHFQIFGPAQSSALLEGILEGQMAPQYFPVQTLKNMGARIDIHAVTPGSPFDVLGCRVTAALNQHGRAGALAFRIEENGRTLVYASDAGYAGGGPPAEVIALYRNADLLIHDSTYTADDRRRYSQRDLASVDEAVLAASRAEARRLVLFHYDADYTDAEVDALLERARDLARASAPSLEVLAASEGRTLTV